jgi:hypothetical protein
VLFTDLVRSTQLAQRLGGVRMEQVRRNHFALLREAVARAGGTEVKSVGDGLMIACPSAGSAVSCAVAMQQGVEFRNRAGGPELGLRVGVALGDVVAHDGDWYGNAVTEAKRLCDLAPGGEILVTDVVHRLAAADGPAMRSLGPRVLKGLAQPIETWTVDWDPVPAAAGLPAPLAALVPAVFVGRRSERGEMVSAWERARDGTRSLLLVCGDAGIGKTRLVTHLAAHAQAEGALVLYGRSIQGGGLPYEPWRQALTQLVETGDADLIERHVGIHGGEAVRLVPSLATRVPGVPAPRSSDPETERYLLFGATADLIVDAARKAPAMLVLDDLHWSGRPTLALLKHLELAAPRDVRLLLVATYRDEFRPGEPLLDLLAELRRDSSPTVTRVALTGLSEDEVLTLLEQTAGNQLDVPGAALARQIHRETNGNPFFVTELARHLTESGSIIRGVDGRWTAAPEISELPRSVQEVVLSRVMQLGSEALRILSTAAVIGRDFELALLARVEDMDEDEVLEILDMARTVALVTDDAAGRYSFVHALVTHALQAHLSATRRERLHGRIARVLEEAPDPMFGELAAHWAAAGPHARAKAVTYANAAGRAALAQLAPDQAAESFERAISMHGQRSDADEATACELLLGLGEAQLHAGIADFRETLLDAAERAARNRDHGRLVRAALANWRGFASATGFVDEQRVAVLEAALAHVSASDARRARLLAQLAAELLWDRDHERRRSLSDEAVELARRSGDAATLAHVLTLRATAVWWPETLPDRRAETAELIDLVDGLDDPLQRFWARTWCAITAVQASDLDGAEHCLTTMREITGRLAHPRLRFVMATQEAWRAQLAGRLESAEEWMDHAYKIGEEAGEADAFTLYAAQRISVRWHQGRLAEDTELLTQMSEEVPAVSLFEAMDALARCEAGEDAHALASLDRHARTGFAALASDPVHLTALTAWSELTGRLGAVDAAKALLPRLEAVREQVVLDSLGTFGVMSRCAGVVAGVLGRAAEADTHFIHALDVHERLGATSLVARTRLDWGLVLAQRGGSDAGARARGQLARAESEARELGLPAIAERAAAAVGSR